MHGPFTLYHRVSSLQKKTPSRGQFLKANNTMERILEDRFCEIDYSFKVWEYFHFKILNAGPEKFLIERFCSQTVAELKELCRKKLKLNKDSYRKRKSTYF